MDRAQKEAAVAELTEDLKGAEAIFAVDYRGISVTEAAELRAQAAPRPTRCSRWSRTGSPSAPPSDAGTEGLDELLVGPTALTLINGDAVIAAKAISTFSREHEVLESTRAGSWTARRSTPDAFTAIARLPGARRAARPAGRPHREPAHRPRRAASATMISGLGVASSAQIAEQGLVTGEPPRPREPRRGGARRGGSGRRGPPAEDEPADGGRRRPRPTKSADGSAEAPAAEDRSLKLKPMTHPPRKSSRRRDVRATKARTRSGNQDFNRGLDRGAEGHLGARALRAHQGARGGVRRLGDRGRRRGPGRRRRRRRRRGRGGVEHRRRRPHRRRRQEDPGDQGGSRRDRPRASRTPRRSSTRRRSRSRRASTARRPTSSRPSSRRPAARSS